MTEREVLKQALDALEAWETGCGTTEYLALVEKAVTAIKEALAQPEQEPVAYTGNGTAGRETDVKPTGFFFQADKIGTYTSDNPEHQKLDLSLCDAKRVQLPIKEALAQPEQEPVVWMYQDKSTHEVRFQKHMRDFVDHGATYETPLYTTPPQLEREPVAWMTHSNDLLPMFHKTRASALNWETQPSPLYTTPPQRTWVGLTDEDKAELDAKYGDDTLAHLDAIEAKLKDKNT